MGLLAGSPLQRGPWSHRVPRMGSTHKDHHFKSLSAGAVTALSTWVRGFPLGRICPE